MTGILNGMTPMLAATDPELDLMQWIIYGLFWVCIILWVLAWAKLIIYWIIENVKMIFGK